MAYTPLSQRVAEAMRKKGAQPQDSQFDWNTPERTRHLAPAPQKHEPAGDVPFTWDTPERTRNLAIRPPVAKKDSGPRQMSMNEAMRTLRKLARKP